MPDTATEDKEICHECGNEGDIRPRYGVIAMCEECYKRIDEDEDE